MFPRILNLVKLTFYICGDKEYLTLILVINLKYFIPIIEFSFYRLMASFGTSNIVISKYKRVSAMTNNEKSTELYYISVKSMKTIAYKISKSFGLKKQESLNLISKKLGFTSYQKFKGFIEEDFLEISLSELHEIVDSLSKDYNRKKEKVLDFFIAEKDCY